MINQHTSDDRSTHVASSLPQPPILCPVKSKPQAWTKFCFPRSNFPQLLRRSEFETWIQETASARNIWPWQCLVFICLSHSSFLSINLRMASSASSLNNPINSHSNFSFSNQFMTSFTDLLSNNKTMDQNNELSWGLSDHKSDRFGNEIPKFKSLPPPSLPLSPPPLSPSSYLVGLSPTDFLMSPLFGSNYNVSYKLHMLYELMLLTECYLYAYYYTK